MTISKKKVKAKADVNRDYSAIALKYCSDVISEKIPACKWVQLACLRHLNDLEKSKSPDYPYRYDVELGDRRCRFSELLTHTKGKWAGNKIILEPHQIFMQSCIFGWVKKKNNKRRFSKAFIELPRKNGKSIDAATTGLYMLVADGEKGSECYCLDSNTKILGGDLIWKRLGDFSIGDEVVAFDEYPESKWKFRKLRWTNIVSMNRIVLPCYRLTFADGRSIICSYQHKWLGFTPHAKDYVWKMTGKMKEGFRVIDFGLPWDVENTREAGYLAGVYDGEGWIRTTQKISASGNRDRHGYSIGFSQNLGEIFDNVFKWVTNRGFKVAKPRVAGKRTCWLFEIKTAYDCLRFLGQIRPSRLVINGVKRFNGMAIGKYHGSCEVISKEWLGDREVIAVETGTHTLFAEGLFSHNSGATTEKQALEVFRPAWQMVNSNPALREKFNISLSGTPKNPTSIYRLSDMSRFELLIGNPGDGASPHCGIHDEYHESKTSDQVDTIETGMGSREQPLQLVITTAGTDTSLPCYDLHLRCIKILEGTIEDDSQFAIIYTIDPDDDYRDFENWKKANPNYLISIEEDYLIRKHKETLSDVSKQNINLTKHLNVWTNAGTAWMNMTKWAACANPLLNLSQFKGRPCYCALDLASKIDICALVLLFEGNERTVKRMMVDPVSESGEEVEREVTQKDFIAFAKYYLPAETVQLPGNDHYVKWVKEGWIIETPGARTDFFYIENDLKVINKENPIIELAFDPREATYLINNVSDWLGNHSVDGEEVSRCVEITQGPQLMSEAMKEVEARVYSQTLWHCNDPVFNWMMANVVKKQGRNSGPIKSYYPTKEKTEFKIDAPVSLIMAVSRAMKKKEMGSVYDNLSLEDMRKKLRGEI